MSAGTARCRGLLCTSSAYGTNMTEEITRAQFGNPTGEEGRRVLDHMNGHHIPLWDFCLGHLPRSLDGSVLDIGCGGGGFLRRMSEWYPYAMLFGVDISEESLRMTRDVNADTVESGGLDLRMASAESLPFDDGSFDMVTAMETYFFWPDIGAGLAEAARVLSPGGVLAVGSELRYGSGDDAAVDEACAAYGMRILPDDDILGIMDAAGLDAEVFVGEPGVLYRGVKRL